MIKLNNLKFLPGTMKQRKRVSRGNSGKASGRGLKGQKARSGVSLKNFQGGQTPLERRVPKHNNFYVKEKSFIALPLEYLDNVLEELYSTDIFNKTETGCFMIDRMILDNFGFTKDKKKIKLIGSTKFSIEIEADYCSKGALDSIVKNNGKLIVVGE